MRTALILEFNIFYGATKHKFPKNVIARNFLVVIAIPRHGNLKIKLTRASIQWCTKRYDPRYFECC